MRLGMKLRREWFADKPLLDNVADKIILAGAHCARIGGAFVCGTQNGIITPTPLHAV